jgi:lipooligosaccharide transport system permease protein
MWRGSVATSFGFPVLYLAALGVGLGGMVDRQLGGASRAGTAGLAALGGVTYLVFVAPGLLAGSAMQIATSESTFPIMAAVKWERTYEAMLATPLGVRDVLAGHLGYIAARLCLANGAFLVIAAGFGALHSPEAIAALPFGVLTGMAFAAPIAAYAVTQDTVVGFNVVNRLLIVPLFLFSGSFFPITQLPGPLRVVAELTPLYHGVALCRAATLGHLATPSTIGHLAYLVALAAIGVAVAARTYRKRLAS